jgi:hypothetical protein
LPLMEADPAVDAERPLVLQDKLLKAAYAH